MKITKPFKLVLPMLVLFIGVGLLSMGLQTFVMDRINNESLRNYQEALIESRKTETASLAQVVSNDISAFRSQIYTLYSGTQFKRLKTSMAEGIIASRYLQDCVYMWSELKMRIFDNRLLSEISLYMTDSGRKVTTGSVVRTDEAETELLERIIAQSDSMALIDGNLYLWVPQFLDKNKSMDNMGCIAVGLVTSNTASRYLHQFSTDVSDAGLMMLYADESGIRPISQLKQPALPEQLIVQRPGGLLAVACDEGYGVARVQQLDHGLHLLGTEVEFL